MSPRVRFPREGGGTTADPDDPRAERSRPLRVPCHRCIFCRKRAAVDYFLRLVHEAQMWERTGVPTFTYSDDKMPPGRSVDRAGWDRFIAAYRHRLGRRGQRIRVDGVSEYSPAPRLRPHYHMIFFGWWPDDARPFGESKAKQPMFVSDELTAAWGRGHVTFQEFTPAAARYIASHQTDKLFDTARASSLERVDGETGEVYSVEPVFHVYPTRPCGLGGLWAERYMPQLLAHDYVVHDGRRFPVPLYYDELRKRADPARWLELAVAREARAADPLIRADSTDGRMVAREVVERARQEAHAQRRSL